MIPYIWHKNIIAENPPNMENYRNHLLDLGKTLMAKIMYTPAKPFWLNISD